jgi:4,5-dihydroxyphthalate decarboxylase
MTILPIKLACWDYDRTRPLIDGRVQAKDIALNIKLMRPQQAFQALLQQSDFHVAEMSLATFVTLKARGECPFVGIPVMLSKMFRHSCIYVRTDAGIRTAADLKGKRVGITQFSSTGIVFMKGMLQHDHGVKQSDMEWWLGGLHAPVKPPATLPSAPGVRIHAVPETKTIENMLKAGELDVILSNHFPALFEQGWPGIARLFPEYKKTEQDYYRHTGIFPIMHTLVIREDVHRQHPWVAASLYRAFCEARDMAVNGLYDTDALRLSLPWLIDHVEEARRTFGPDFFAYGVEPNRAALTAIGQYLHEQGLAPRAVPPEELFAAV